MNKKTVKRWNDKTTGLLFNRRTQESNYYVNYKERKVGIKGLLLI